MVLIVMAKQLQAEPFKKVDSADEDAPRRGRRVRIHKLRVPVGETPDWSGYSEDEKSDIIGSFLADDDFMAQVEQMRQDDGDVSSIDVITAKPVEMLLDLICTVERWLLPRIIARKTKGKPGFEKFPNGFIIPAQVADAAYQFKEPQRAEIVANGAKFANESLPPKIKKAICAVAGPGTQFAYGILCEFQRQQKSAMLMTIALYQKQQPSQQQQNPNVVVPSATPMSDNPPPRPNGNVPHHVESPLIKISVEGQTA